VSAWLAFAYGVLALGLAWTLTSGGHWRRRIPYIVCAPALALALWVAKADPAGWPSTAKLPAHAGLIWAQVDEPDPATADPGRIYLWLDVGKSAPRAYSVPYSRTLHQQVERALQAVKHGQPIGVGRASAAHASGRHGAQGQDPRAAIHFYAHPPVRLPPKPRSSAG
jgi:hypothetical protein